MRPGVDLTHELTVDLTCGLKRLQRCFWVTFAVAILHITWLSYVLVELIMILGCIWEISEVV